MVTPEQIGEYIKSGSRLCLAVTLLNLAACSDRSIINLPTPNSTSTSEIVAVPPTPILTPTLTTTPEPTITSVLDISDDIIEQLYPEASVNGQTIVTSVDTLTTPPAVITKAYNFSPYKFDILEAKYIYDKIASLANTENSLQNFRYKVGGEDRILHLMLNYNFRHRIMAILDSNSPTYSLSDNQYGITTQVGNGHDEYLVSFVRIADQGFNQNRLVNATINFTVEACHQTLKSLPYKFLDTKPMGTNTVAAYTRVTNPLQVTKAQELGCNSFGLAMALSLNSVSYDQYVHIIASQQADTSWIDSGRLIKIDESIYNSVKPLGSIVK